MSQVLAFLSVAFELKCCISNVLEPVSQVGKGLKLVVTRTLL